MRFQLLAALGFLFSGSASAGEGLKVNPPTELSAVPAQTLDQSMMMRTWAKDDGSVQENVLLSRLPKSGQLLNLSVDQLGARMVQTFGSYCGELTSSPAVIGSMVGYPSYDVTYDCRPAVLPRTGEQVATRDVRRYVFVSRGPDLYWLQMDMYFQLESLQAAAEVARRWDATVATLSKCDDLVELESCL